VAVIGYARVSTSDHPEAQMARLGEHGCIQVFADHGVTGIAAGQPQWDAGRLSCAGRCPCGDQARPDRPLWVTGRELIAPVGRTLTARYVSHPRRYAATNVAPKGTLCRCAMIASASRRSIPDPSLMRGRPR